MNRKAELTGRLVGLQEAAKLIGMSYSWLRKQARKAGSGLKVFYLGRRPMVDVDHLMKWARGEQETK